MMEEEFYSTIKLTSGEEIVAKVCYLPEENSLLVESPMKVEKVKQKKNGFTVEGFTLNEWIHSTYDNMFIIPMNTVITMTELDKKIETYYLNILNGDDIEEDAINVNPSKFSKRMGYLGSVNETKKFLEDIFKRS
jgi:hypothetical protein